MDKSSPSSEQKKAEKPAKKQRNWAKIRRNALFFVIFLAIVVPVGLMLWWSYFQQQQINALTDQLSQFDEVETDIAALGRSSQRNASGLKVLDETLQKQGLAIRDLEQREPLTDKAIRLRWTIQEVDYLLQLANQRTVLANDARGAKQALQLADDKVRDINDYRFQPLRQIIADEQLALDAVAKADIAGIAADLQSAINAIDSLRVVKGPKQFAKDPMADPNADLTTVAGWRDAVSDIWQQIRSLIVIRQQEDAPQAVLIPEQRYFLYQNLRLKLETARFAVLSGRQSIYDSSLETSIDWLEQFFVGEQRDALLSTLENLQAEKIQVALPDISGSLRWLQDFEP
ncbi:uroporphyrinogen-III C-methyltransferase [Methylophaga sp. OBS3]|uniref:uroporphyrinogen-III C-methyltransferase n=1 Tax=Methylophaga sp. OBS3 TaxID=2991934 RepID=UPI002259D9DA|nr:uroporphyrinogen-III C-methyltransferase [Methylophaga sp. OBS3]MCX4189853.1 uroporphyrinogen-III C-methyltransferase [Methylophaga sp. OBS3]